MRSLGLGLLGLGLIFWWLTRPDILADADLDFDQPNLANGELMFHAGSCAACHEADLRGGMELKTDFGIFRVPNISPDPETGIGRWSQTDFANAMLRGVSPEGKHYYPAFPYTSYTRMQVQDVVDIMAYIDRLPPVQHVVADSELGFPWSIRRGIGLWKLRYLNPEPWLELAGGADAALLRGRYLVEGPGHCSECHTERDAFGGIRLKRWMAGAPNPDGEGRIPNITPDASGLAEWSIRDITYFLEAGLTPDYDTVGGSMVAVQENLARLGSDDRAAISAYLKALPAKVNAD